MGIKHNDLAIRPSAKRKRADAVAASAASGIGGSDAKPRVYEPVELFLFQNAGSFRACVERLPIFIEHDDGSRVTGDIRFPPQLDVAHGACYVGQQQIHDLPVMFTEIALLELTMESASADHVALGDERGSKTIEDADLAQQEIMAEFAVEQLLPGNDIGIAGNVACLSGCHTRRLDVVFRDFAE